MEETTSYSIGYTGLTNEDDNHIICPNCKKKHPTHPEDLLGSGKQGMVCNCPHCDSNFKLWSDIYVEYTTQKEDEN
jgi:uncharacterized Zn-finger protein